MWLRRALALTLLVLALPASAGVRVERGEDGRIYITNESAVQHARRVATHLVPVPQHDLSALIDYHAEAQRLEPRLVRAVIQVESGYNPRALSNKGAMGLMQLTAATAQDLRVDDPYDPEENLRGGTQYLRALIDRFLRLELALAAYNAGPGAVEKHSGIPPYPETLDYVRRVLRLYRGVDEPLAGVRLEKKGRTPFVIRRNGRTIITTDPAEYQ